VCASSLIQFKGIFIAISVNGNQQASRVTTTIGEKTYGKKEDLLCGFGGSFVYIIAVSPAFPVM
jgi:hypothetical protein